MAAGGSSRGLGATLTWAWGWTALAVVAATFAAIHAGVGRYLTLGFVAQDLPVIAVATVVVIACRLCMGHAHPARQLESGRTILALMAAVTVLAILGSRLIFRGYPLSMDEFLATFDARILRGGHLIAPVAPPYRDLLPALITSFRLPVVGNDAWASLYLPGNAMLLALPGGSVWVPPVLAGLSVALVWAIAGRLVPARRDTAMVAALLLASSSQLLVTAMTAYAMTAHLALNLLWLWLVLLNRRWSHGVAAAVAWLATGLHQLIFHPLFAAPFVLRMWREKRWGAASFHTVAYLAIGLFWVSYHSLALGVEGLASGTAGPTSLLSQARDLATAFTLADLGLMAQNMLRFIAWQNPLMVALFVISLGTMFRAKGIERDLLLGIALTLLVMTVLMPVQGFGWGYRYLHGLLGNVALLAAFTWDRLVGEDRGGRDRGFQLVGIGAALSFLVLFPIQLWQAQRLVAPDARASQQIAQVDADYVLIDRGDIAYGADLVRNDPWLHNRPKILDLAELEPLQLRQLCRDHGLAIFGTPEGIAAGIAQLHFVPPELARNRRLLTELKCDRRRVGMG
jgi:hypothetical protein